MGDGCTDCGRKGGCDGRKHAMFGAIDAALTRLYPTRCWDARDDEAAFRGGVLVAEQAALAAALRASLKTVVVARPGGPEEYCDYLYVLCLGRTPALVELAEWGSTAVDVEMDLDVASAPAAVEETYLRVALSTLARVAGVQQVALSLAPSSDGWSLTERPRAGVFDPPLLPRLQAVVAALAGSDILHLDFGELLEPPSGFDPGQYAQRYGGLPVTANYLFFPHPTTAVTTVSWAGPSAQRQ